jgi:hypothetical protein
MQVADNAYAVRDVAKDDDVRADQIGPVCRRQIVSASTVNSGP